MESNAFLIANIVAIISSIGSYIFKLEEICRTNRKKVARVILLSVVLMVILGILIFRTKYYIETTEQNGKFLNYSRGNNEVFYPKPYKTPPNLEFELGVKTSNITHGPEIIEQRADGFKVKIDLGNELYIWKAKGILQ